MEMLRFKPLEETQGQVVGYLHSPITEMEIHREKYPCVLVCPGGAYAMVSQREADPVALRFFAAGYQVFLLTYSVGEQARDFRPLKEASETVIRIRENAEAWHVDPDRIAVCGFSAGGHLAGSLGILWDSPKLLETYDNKGGKNRPNAMILSYPVITADEFAHVESIENVSGCPKGSEGYAYFSLDRQVSEKTCPTFLWHTVPDDCVPVENSIRLMEALQRHGISYEAHFFPRGGHGISVCTKETGTPDSHNAQWMELCLRWLNQEFEYQL